MPGNGVPSTNGSLQRVWDCCEQRWKSALGFSRGEETVPKKRAAGRHEASRAFHRRANQMRKSRKQSPSSPRPYVNRTSSQRKLGRRRPASTACLGPRDWVLALNKVQPCSFARQMRSDTPRYVILCHRLCSKNPHRGLPLTQPTFNQRCLSAKSDAG